MHQPSRDWETLAMLVAAMGSAQVCDLDSCVLSRTMERCTPLLEECSFCLSYFDQ